MKLWQKVFLCTFLLFEVLFNVSFFYLIEHNFNQNLHNEIERGLSDQLIVLSQIQTDWSYVSTLPGQMGMTGGVQDFLKNNARKYIQYYDANKVFLEILDTQNNTVFTDFTGKTDGQRLELSSLDSGERNYIIRDIESETYLFVCSDLTLDNKAFKVSYIRDISNVYRDKSSQISLFFKMNIAITVILAGGLYALIWFLTRSLRSLNKTAQTIADGDYTRRTTVLSNDEIGVLAGNFNQMAEAIESKVNELELTANKRQNFIDCLTHELKTPLTSIIGYAEFLRTAKYNEEIFFKSLTYIYKEGRRLESLSFKLMDLILVGKEKPEMHYESVSSLCSDIEEALKPQLERLNVALRTDIEPQKILVERDLFKLLCTNLVDNAIKASKPGGCIYLRGRVTGDVIYAMEIEDEGIGIPEQDIQRIFEPFFVVDKARSKAHHGAGLGLAICAEIVRLHEGKIEVTSQMNAGTKVRIEFPQIYN
ncbi:HAMP domain-containing sensor histidine kinase [Oscillospiraceae bacterium WX1]